MAPRPRERQVGLSVVVPCFNEAESIPFFHTRLTAVLTEIGGVNEIIYVDDGSRDETFATVRALGEGCHAVSAIRLSRNFGKESAMLAGLTHAIGRASVIIDADLEEPPELILDMHRKWSQGDVDVVYAVRRSRRHDTYLKRVTAAIFYRVFASLSEFEFPQNAGDFRLMSRRAVRAVLSLPERTRFSKGIFAWIGFRTDAVFFDRPCRKAGRTKWTFPKLIGLSLQAITSFSIVPLRLASVVGVVAALVSGIYGLRLVLDTMIFGTDQPGYPSLMTALIFFAGLQLIFMGVLGEYVGRIFVEAKQRPHFLIDRFERIAPRRWHKRERNIERAVNEPMAESVTCP